MNDPIILDLKGFVQRTNATTKLKQLIKTSGEELKRKGRSRNWQLTTSLEQLIKLSHQIELASEPSWLWITKQITLQKPCFSFQELHRIAKENSPLTINKLVSITDCSLSDARKVIDNLEWEI
jgi:hypothetical protein